MACYYFSKRQASTIANGLFLVLLGILFYIEYWWPGILFALVISYAVRYYLAGQKTYLVMSLIVIGILTLLTLTDQTFSTPIILIGIGLFLIIKEYLFRKSGPDIEIIDKPK